MINRKNSASGFTLLELMITTAIIGIMSIGLFRLFGDGMYMWKTGMARLSLAAEARLTMSLLTKFINSCQASTIRISRYNTSCPANSYISARIGETIYVTTTQDKLGGCGCRWGSYKITVGDSNDPTLNHVEIFQYYDAAAKKSLILAKYPVIPPGTDITDSEDVRAKAYYKTATVSANADSLMFSFEDSAKGGALSMGASFSKQIWQNRPPVEIFVKKTAVLKHFHSAGYYGN